MTEQPIETKAGPMADIRGKASGWHFAKEALSDTERGMLHVLEGLVDLVDGLTPNGYFRGYRSEIGAGPRPPIEWEFAPYPGGPEVGGDEVRLVVVAGSQVMVCAVWNAQGDGWRFNMPPGWSVVRYPTAEEAADAACAAVRAGADAEPWWDPAQV
jgi:hypothetical protein